MTNTNNMVAVLGLLNAIADELSARGADAKLLTTGEYTGDTEPFLAVRVRGARVFITYNVISSTVEIRLNGARHAAARIDTDEVGDATPAVVADCACSLARAVKEA